jgi:hypothetical protein
MERYYIKVSGKRGPAIAHHTLEEAYTEARRLFDLRSGSRRVYVLQVIGTLEPKGEAQAAGASSESERLDARTTRTVG